MRVVEDAGWTNHQIEAFRAEADGAPALAVKPYDLAKTLQAVLERAKNRPLYEIDKEDVSVPDMIRYLRHVFETERRTGVISARELFERQRSRRAMICLFLALLELVKLQALGLTQADAFGEIGLKRLQGFDAVLAPEQAMTGIAQGYS